jgi:hypothetical protein
MKHSLAVIRFVRKQCGDLHESKDPSEGVKLP